MDIEAAHFRILLDHLFHLMPTSPATPPGVLDILGALSRLVYVNGKDSVIEAQRVINAQSDEDKAGNKS
jgi:hypothetical protein